MIESAFDLDLSAFFGALKTATAAVDSIKLPMPSLGIKGLSDAQSAVSSMQTALAAANAAATPVASTFARIEGVMHGVAAVARTTSLAMAVLPKVFTGIPPAVGRTLSAMSLASRGFDVFRGKLSPLGAVTGYMELRNLGLKKSYAALVTTVAMATSSVVAASRKISQAAGGTAAAVKNMVVGGIAGVARVGAAGFSALLGPLAALAGAAGIAGLAFFGLQKSISEAADMESLRVAYSTLTGSAARANAVLGQLTKFAKDTPFEMPEVASSGRSLIAFGFAAETVRDELRKVGDIASGVQAPLGEIAEIYGKARVQGRLFAEDINQLTGRGIPIISELAKQFGVSETAIKGLVESGKVGFTNIQQAFTDMTAKGGKFFGMMAMQSRTWNGLMSTLKDSVNAIFREFGAPLIDTLKPILTKGIELGDALAVKAKEFGTSVANTLQSLYGLFKAGQLTEAFRLGLEIAAKSAINILNAGFQGLAASAAVALSSAAEALQQSLGEPAFWEAIAKKMESVFLNLKATLLDVVAEMVALLPESLGGGQSGANSVRGSADAARAWSQVRGLEGDRLFGQVDLPGILSGIFDAAKGSMEAFEKAAGGALPVYSDIPAKVAELQTMLAKGQKAVSGMFKPIEYSPGSSVPGPVKPIQESAGKLVASSLASLGLGGYSGGSNPMVGEQRKMTREMQELRKDLNTTVKAALSRPIVGKISFV